MATYTVGAAGTYKTLNAALLYIYNSGVAGDTIEIIDGLGDNGTGGVYIMSQYVNKAFNITNTYTENPNLFPLVNHTAGDFYSIFSGSVACTWSKLRFNDTFLTGVHIQFASAVTHKFNRIAFIGGTGDLLFDISGGVGEVDVTNCIFSNITKTQFVLCNIGYGSLQVKIRNCTFDTITSWSASDLAADETDNITIQGCIFTGTTVYPTGNNWRSIIKYSLTSEAITNYGDGCVSAADPRFEKGSSRTLPMDWKLKRNSPARNVGRVSSLTTIDIAGNNRLMFDAGAHNIRRNRACAV